MTCYDMLVVADGSQGPCPSDLHVCCPCLVPQAHLELKNYDAAIMDFNKVAELDESYPGERKAAWLGAWVVGLHLTCRQRAERHAVGRQGFRFSIRSVVSSYNLHVVRSPAQACGRCCVRRSWPRRRPTGSITTR